MLWTVWNVEVYKLCPLAPKSIKDPIKLFIVRKKIFRVKTTINDSFIASLMVAVERLLFYVKSRVVQRMVIVKSEGSTIWMRSSPQKRLSRKCFQSWLLFAPSLPHLHHFVLNRGIRLRFSYWKPFLGRHLIWNVVEQSYVRTSSNM